MNKLKICVCGQDDPSMFYPNNKTKCKKCVIDRVKDRYRNFSDEDKANYIKSQSDWQKDNIVRYRYISARNRASKKGWEFTITESFIEELLIRQNHQCAYSGIAFTENGTPHSWSIDRIDSSKGYTIDNIALVSSTVNAMKNDMSYDDMVDICKKIISTSEAMI